jgi:hypothetical protein
VLQTRFHIDNISQRNDGASNGEISLKAVAKDVQTWSNPFARQLAEWSQRLGKISNFLLLDFAGFDGEARREDSYLRR